MKTPDKIVRTNGVTSAERYLKKLCDHSFLSMWSYTGVFNDKGTGQEICDLLVVFGNHIIIFSDKDCEFPNTGDTELDWKRWYKKAIKKSADQVYGAERWILNHPNRLFLDQTCKIPFPIDLPSINEVKVHRIVVAHSASAKSVEIFGGSGSLMINTGIVGDARPFTIGKIEQSKDYIHVFDDTTLDILLTTLDTISDFVAYLEKKERFLTGKTLIVSTGEEELLAHYLKSLVSSNEHDFVFNEDISQYSSVYLGDEGSWLEFSNSPERKLQIQADKISYAWDELIETFAKHILGGTQVDYWNSELSIAKREKILRFMAGESRTRRRFLAKLLLEFIEKTPKEQRATRTIKSLNPDEPFYVFLLFPLKGFMEYEKYRKYRGVLLEKYCLLTKLKHPEAKYIVGIATETGRGEMGSEDAAYLDASEWSDKDERLAKEAERELNELGLIGKYRETVETVKEYPYQAKQIRDFQKLKGRAKNLPCICGSGRKYKKCHGN
jgi:hypothetical protein